jgi:uncharacterized membrane protein HdeD (DUF308 family)
MMVLMSRTWWIWALRGVAAVLFGLAAFIWPEITLTALVILYGAYALVDGLFSVFAAIAGRTAVRRWWALLLQGLSGVAIGVLAFVWPQITALALVFLIAARAFVVGLFEIVLAIWLRQELKIEWFLILSGIVSLVFGLALAIAPGAGALALLWLIAAFAILIGVLLILVAVRLRSLAKSIRQTIGRKAGWSGR